MYGLSNGMKFFNLRWHLEVKRQGQILKKFQVKYLKNGTREKKCQWKLDKKSCMGFRMV